MKTKKCYLLIVFIMLILNKIIFPDDTLTVGSGGTYANFITCFSALPATFTENIVVMMLSNVTDATSSNATINDNIGGYTLEINGNGYKYTKTTNHSPVLLYTSTSSGGTLIVHDINFVHSTAGTGQAFVNVTTITGATDVYVYNCTFSELSASLNYYGVRINDADATFYGYNLLARNLTGRAGISFDACDSNSIVENATVINCNLGIDFKGTSGTANKATAKNCLSLKSIGAVGNSGFYNADSATLINCASDDNTASDTSLMELDFRYLFKDTVFGTSGYLVPSDTGLLYCRASAPTNRPDTIYLNNSVAADSFGLSYPNTTFPLWPVIIDLHDSISIGQGYLTDEKILDMYTDAQCLSGQAVITTTNTDSVQVDQLVVYYGKNGYYWTGVVASIDAGVSITLTENLKDTVESGVRIWSFWSSAVHPTTQGYYSVADYIFRKHGEDFNASDIIVGAGDSWVATGAITTRLSNLSGSTILNKGVSGFTAAEYLAVYSDSVTPANPTKVLFILGTNDWGGGTTAPDYLQTMMALINKSRNDGAVPYVLTPSCAPVYNASQILLSNTYNSAVISSFVDTSFNFIGANGLSFNEIPSQSSTKKIKNTWSWKNIWKPFSW